MRRRRGRENGVVTSIYGNMTPFSHSRRRRVAYAPIVDLMAESL